MKMLMVQAQSKKDRVGRLGGFRRSNVHDGAVRVKMLQVQGKEVKAAG